MILSSTSRSTIVSSSPSQKSLLSQNSASPMCAQSPDYIQQFNRFQRDYVKLADNISILLPHLRTTFSSNLSSIVATLLIGTSSLFRGSVLGEDTAYAKNACRAPNVCRVFQNQAISKKKARTQSMTGNIGQLELESFAAAFSSTLTVRSGASSDLFSISEKKDYFYLKYRSSP